MVNNLMMFLFEFTTRHIGSHALPMQRRLPSVIYHNLSANQKEKFRVLFLVACFLYLDLLQDVGSMIALA